MQLRYSAPPDQYNRGLSIGNLSQTSWAQFPDFSPSFIFASYLFISSMHEARYHKVHCVYQTSSRDVMHSPPSCLRNFLAELSFNVLLLWMKVDRSPPSQYSIIRKMCVSHHCKGVDTTWPNMYILFHPGNQFLYWKTANLIPTPNLSLGEQEYMYHT